MNPAVQQGLLLMMGGVLEDVRPTVEQVEAAQHVTRLSNRKKEFPRIKAKIREKHPMCKGWEVTVDLGIKLKELICED